ncbi:unnamed protein product [Parajaminaea phylloscopi]
MALDPRPIFAGGPMWWDFLDVGPESDDWLHDPAAGDESKRSWRNKYCCCSSRNVCDSLMFMVAMLAIVTLFAAYPILSYFYLLPHGLKDGFGLGGTNLTGQIPELKGLGRSGLIDPDTPASAYRKGGVDNPHEVYELVFSDEFNTNGRSFYPGDDPFWEAVDLNYWGTKNYEWYDPAAITTSGGALHITLSEHPEHNLNFRSGMLQSWNKFCFTGGYFAASVRMPGKQREGGTWPAFWAMGNLGRAGYGATLEGLWPYSYDSECDVGTLPNQTTWDGKPEAAQLAGSVRFNQKHHSNVASFLPGQRLSRCTCLQDDHPGPKLPNGMFRGRSAPELDVFEAQKGLDRTAVSQSAQFAPFTQYYKLTNKTGPAFEFYQDGLPNRYNGELTQQAVSGVTEIPVGAVQRGGDGSFAEYGAEYVPGDSGYITWTVGGKKSWKMFPEALAADPVLQISRRTITNEPLYLILNLGISQAFGTIHWDLLDFPYIMSVDWIRVYQKKGQQNVGCDPADYPTADYIKRHMRAYTDANLTLWGSTEEKGGYGAPWPRNSLNPDGCNARPSLNPGSPTHPVAKAPWRAKTDPTNWDKGTIPPK